MPAKVKKRAMPDLNIRVTLPWLIKKETSEAEKINQEILSYSIRDSTIKTRKVFRMTCKGNTNRAFMPSKKILQFY